MLYRQVIANLERAMGPDHSDVAMALNNLAFVYQDEQRYAEAEPLFQRALAIKERVLGETHPDVATIANNLGSFYLNQGKYAEAEIFLLRSLDIREKTLGPAHPSVANALHNLAKVYFQQHRYDEAEELYSRAVAIMEKGLGPITRSRPHTGQIRFAVARTKRKSEASTMKARAKAILTNNPATRAAKPNRRRAGSRPQVERVKKTGQELTTKYENEAGC
jgi:Tfp pilus assembly protein PilF